MSSHDPQARSFRAEKLTHEPCTGCTRMIAGSGIIRTVWGAPSATAAEALQMVLRRGLLLKGTP